MSDTAFFPRVGGMRRGEKEKGKRESPEGLPGRFPSSSYLALSILFCVITFIRAFWPEGVRIPVLFYSQLPSLHLVVV